AVVGLAHHRQVRLGIHERDEAHAHDEMVVDDEDADGIRRSHVVGEWPLGLTVSGSETETVVPSPCAPITEKRPPRRLLRSAMPSRPKCRSPCAAIFSGTRPEPL